MGLNCCNCEDQMEERGSNFILCVYTEARQDLYAGGCWPNVGTCTLCAVCVMCF